MVLENLNSVLQYEIKFDFSSVVSFVSKQVGRECEEDIEIGNDFFILNKKESYDKIREISNKLNDMFKSTGEQLVKDSFHTDTLFLYDGCRTSNKNNRDPVDKTKLSFSFYYDLSLDRNFDNLSTKLNTRITNITLKFSTHLSEKQFKDMFNNPGRTFYVVEIPPIIEQNIKVCLNNIYQNYLDAVDIIEQSNKTYQKYGDFPNEVRSLFEEFKIQKV